jgi:hypothetical protein
MTSIIKVDQIQDTAGTVLMDNEPVVDLWRLTAAFGTNAVPLTGWERPDDGYGAYINGLTESSGTFTFSKTGLYQVTCRFHAQNTSSSDNSFGLVMQVSTDGGSTYDWTSIGYCGETVAGTNNGSTLVAHLNVTDISAFKLQLITNSMSAGTLIAGSTTYNYTSVAFLKLAPAQ